MPAHVRMHTCMYVYVCARVCPHVCIHVVKYESYSSNHLINNMFFHILDVYTFPEFGPHLLAKSFSVKSPSGRGGERLGRGLPCAKPVPAWGCLRGKKALAMVIDSPRETPRTLQEDDGPELGPLDI